MSEPEDKDLVFPKELVSNAIKNAVDSVITFDTPYEHQKVPQQVSNIVETSIKRLAQLDRPYKYIVTCTIMQNNGAGFHTASSAYWDSCDGTYIHKVEGKNLYVITTVFALSL